MTISQFDWREVIKLEFPFSVTFYPRGVDFFLLGESNSPPFSVPGPRGGVQDLRELKVSEGDKRAELMPTRWRHRHFHERPFHFFSFDSFSSCGSAHSTVKWSPGPSEIPLWDVEALSGGGQRQSQVDSHVLGQVDPTRRNRSPKSWTTNGRGFLQEKEGSHVFIGRPSYTKGFKSLMFS